ncbi:MAG: SDR family oxidoreductase [Bdellovibrionota bacterium]
MGELDRQKSTFVVTGGASGIGLACAKWFASKGYHVAILDLKVMEERVPNSTYLRCDVSSYENVQSCINTLVSDGHRIEATLANAGIHFYGSVEETSVEDLSRIIDVNIKGVFYTLKAVLPHMKASQKGSIVIMGSDQSLVGKFYSAAYGLTKGAIAQLAKSTAIDYGTYDVRVNCVCPGPVKTSLYDEAVQSFSQSYSDLDPDTLHELIKDRLAIKKIADPMDVAKLVYFLCSDEASMITGSTYSIDGGYCAQ